MSSSDADDLLMQKFCQGDEGAFDELYDRYSGKVYAFLSRMLRDAAAAEDTMQLTFMSFVRGRGRYQPGTNVRGWLFAIAANAGRDALRRRSARPELSVTPDTMQMGAAPTSDPGLARDIDAAFAALPPGEREAIILHKVCGFSFEEISDSLGISLSAAKVRAHRGYQRLRVTLGPVDLERAS